MPKIVSLVKLASAAASAIRAVDAAVELVEVGGWFDGEYAQSWPAETVARYVRGAGYATQPERDAILAEAEIILGGFPLPLDLRSRAPKLQWVHQTPAGASNLRSGDLWGSDVAVSTSRGYGETTAIAEYAIAGIMYFAKGFERANIDRERGTFDNSQYNVRSIEEKTLCVVGAGGIGSETARLGKVLGMRTVGTRASPQLHGEPNFDQVAGPDGLHDLLSKSDYVVVSCQWTESTTKLLDEQAFAAMKRGAILVNVARGEIVDENALISALDSGHLHGAILDVYVGEFESPPPQRLWQHPKILITPHISYRTDQSRHRAIELFCTNLDRFLNGESLDNRIDWADGY
jgi:phosphoglycerate dehydrogenase-like enzyme